MYSLSLGTLPAGEYRLEITIADMAAPATRTFVVRNGSRTAMEVHPFAVPVDPHTITRVRLHANGDPLCGTSTCDDVTGESRIHGIPAGPRFRVTLRLYTNDDALQSFRVAGRIVVPVRQAAGEPRFASVDVTKLRLALGSSAHNLPWYASQPLTIQTDYGMRYWAMVTVYDTETHEIRILTPVQ